MAQNPCEMGSAEVPPAVLITGVGRLVMGLQHVAVSNPQEGGYLPQTQ
jgi:hypothetical protein